jgi:hypothetical protein
MRYIFIAIVIVAMVFYHNTIQYCKRELKVDPGNIEILAIKNSASMGYSIVLVVFGALYKIMSF